MNNSTVNSNLERIHSHWDEVQAWHQFWMKSHILTQTLYSPVTWNHIVAHYRERDEIDK